MYRLQRAGWLGFLGAMAFFFINYSAAVAQTATIQGTVILESSNPVTVGGNIGGYGLAPSDNSASSDPGLNDIIIWLEDKNEAAFYQRHDSVTKVLDQVDKQFKPRLMAVRVGNYVRIKNSDPVYHNVFSLSRTKRFDVGRRSPKEYRDVLFDQPGTVDVFCDIHSDMHAVIKVLPKQTVSWYKLDNSGDFSFEKIPNGDYRIHFFALGDRQKSLDVRVVDGKNIKLQAVRLGS
ncbi:hypothetical protein NC796_20570 [Aliifodinibius sp. S!AR15-10]|uniref:hypothetical protein n=1 Tax=Aliifodinibius sp. S!AR15-10 TaxID=2950437 RepID=UPI00285E553D|nr:hypothetical protein [Aliifodinibius sp. S!AR15-10]MDR8393559.1 hypothetical protein [Aliifodinibius sp. S!AR15-10]